MEVRTRFVIGHRFWRASGGHLVIVIVALQLHSLGMASGVNLEEQSELESLKQFVVVFKLILATPATSLVPNCNGPAVPLDPSPSPHITLPRFTSIQSPAPASIPGEDTPALPSAWTQHGNQQIPVISHHSIGVEHGAKGCSQRWERSSDLTGQLSLASSWAARSQ